MRLMSLRISVPDKVEIKPVTVKHLPCIFVVTNFLAKILITTITGNTCCMQFISVHDSTFMFL